MKVHVFTSAAINYLPKVRILFASLRRLYPEWRLHLAVADSPPSPAALASIKADEVHLLQDLEIPEVRAWAFSHSLVELATALKPFVLVRLLARRDCDAVIYLDPDIVVFSRLSEIEDGLSRADILLTPHQTRPELTVDGVVAHEICTLQHGIYNLGFVAVANRGDGPAFAEWWRQRAYRFCRVDLPSGLFTDQRWIDLAPAFFNGVEALRSTRLNVAPWNLSSRNVVGRAPQTLSVNGEPLGFFHFSAIDRSDVFGGSYANNAVAELATWYRKKIKPTRNDRRWLSDWGFDAFDDGELILREQRLVYRLRGDLQRAFPDPFSSGQQSFQCWWQHQAPLEYPKLFTTPTRDAEKDRLSSALSTGYVELSP